MADMRQKKMMNAGMGVGGGAASGATMGSAFGPWGTAIGAGIGAIAGGIGAGMRGAKEDAQSEELMELRRQELAEDKAARMQQRFMGERDQNMSGFQLAMNMRNNAMNRHRFQTFRDGFLQSVIGGA